MNFQDKLFLQFEDNNYNIVVNKLQDYMLNENKIENSIKSKIVNNKSIYKKENKYNDENKYNEENKYKNEKENIKNKYIILKDESNKDLQSSTNSLFFPREKDSLFWCFYIMKYGEASYEMIDFKNLIIEKKIKIEYVEKLRKEKQLLKTYKFATLTHIENQLANEQQIDINTFLTLCVLENLNIFYISKNTYFELLMNDTSVIHLIKKGFVNGNKYVANFGYKIDNKESEELTKYKNEFYKIDNIDKPIKSISAYKVQELTDFCNKLNIETINNETKKNKNKNELYESLIQYF
jgi:hypothetical protein